MPESVDNNLAAAGLKVTEHRSQRPGQVAVPERRSPALVAGFLVLLLVVGYMAVVSVALTPGPVAVAAALGGLVLFALIGGAAISRRGARRKRAGAWKRSYGAAGPPGCPRRLISWGLTTTRRDYQGVRRSSAATGFGESRLGVTWWLPRTGSTSCHINARSTSLRAGSPTSAPSSCSPAPRRTEWPRRLRLPSSRAGWCSRLTTGGQGFSTAYHPSALRRSCSRGGQSSARTSRPRKCLQPFLWT